ncbi:FCD domain-containing protein [Amycolatopsis sp. K13G38]|uniref:FCD domain-containing protein n=1 Tax=Amycolatopsis acididurans TaxID=2724524 RepID=A0ABX1JF62_9PSEU|nr:FCD domain-containing protein [Amycolatopsis acididurans]NKQ56887.1 FCD domain-containing protein [Amycolatopsis acididurans]
MAPLSLTEAERSTLLAWATDESGSRNVRSRIVLGCAEGLSQRELATSLGVSPATVGKWRDRFVERGLDGLADAPRAGRPRSPDRAEAERLVVTAISQARRGERVPSTRSVARSVGLSQSTVARIWREHSESEPPRTAVAGRLPKGLLSDSVYQLLRTSIVNGELLPGQRLVEAEIARQLGTSQAPAREAIKRLAHEGLVSSLPHRGNYVAEISQEQAREVREVRVLIEGYAARQAATDMRPRSRNAMAAAVEAMREAARRGDIGAFRDADLTFHREVCAAAGNAFLNRIWRTIESSMWNLRVVGNPLYAGDWPAMAERHADLLAALTAGEPDTAERLFAAHAAGHGSSMD